jgi:hypothetical protein
VKLNHQPKQSVAPRQFASLNGVIVPGNLMPYFPLVQQLAKELPPGYTVVVLSPAHQRLLRAVAPSSLQLAKLTS